jgi:flagellar motility protein MotE (MotC chaperone)
MGRQHYRAFIQSIASQDDRERRAELWAALSDCLQQAEGTSREQVLRELLDDAHERIRTLEAAIESLLKFDEPEDPAPSDG